MHSRLFVVLCLFLTSFAASAQTQDLYLPHYTFVNQDWTTRIDLVNPTAALVNVNVSVYNADGSLNQTQTLHLPAFGAMRGDLRDIFAEELSESGWLHLQTTETDVAGQVAFTAVQPGGTGSLPLTQEVGKRLVMANVTQNDAWVGGFAVVNTTGTVANLTLTAYADDGRPLAVAAQSLDPRQKWVSLLGMLFDVAEIDEVSSVIIDADQEITGFALNFTPDSSQIVPVPVTAIAGQASLPVSYAEVRGQYRRLGYDEYLTVDKDSIALIETIGGTCVSNLSQGDLDDLDPGEIVFTQLADGRLQMTTDLDQSFFYVPHVGALPNQECAESNSYTQNLETLIQLFDDHYAFFDLRAIDWSTIKQTYRDNIGTVQNDGDFAAYLNDMLSNFDDPHVWLHAEEYGSTSSIAPRRYELGLQQAFQEQSEIADYTTFRTNKLNESVAITLSYLDGDTLAVHANGQIVTGRMEDNPGVGYLGIFQMTGFGGDFFDLEDNLVALGAALDGVFNALGDVDQLVVDVRLNGGGFDGASRLIANRLTPNRQRAYSKAARDGDVTAPFETYWLEPYGGSARFNGTQIVLLTSEMTASAAEVFTLCMRSIPGVVHLGEPTSGGISDVLSRDLPNGWEIWLANETYLDRDGLLWEGPGVEPHERVLHFAGNDHYGETDTALEAAISRFLP